MKNKICFSLSLLLSFLLVEISFAADIITREQAITILREQVIDPIAEADFLMAFGPQQMLSVGDTVRPSHDQASPYQSSSRDIETPTWFFWVDTNKWAKFVHLSYFVYIDASHLNPTIGDGIYQDEQGWWPVINDVDYLRLQDERFTTQDIVYGDQSTEPPK